MSSMRRVARSMAASESFSGPNTIPSWPTISRWVHSTLTGLRSSWVRVITMSRR